jgi:predicted signal transduction protein with EAL and GGDEF domain
VGDQLLVSVAARLLSALRPGDSIARFAGDAFVVVCEETNEQEAHELAAQLLAALAAPFDLDDQRVYIGASIGIALSPPQPASDLLRFAGAAMHDAKARGRGRAHVFDAALAEESRDRLELSNDLREAMSRDQLALHYQPVVELATGRMLAVEALARWHHPTRGDVPAAHLVHVAEVTGLAASLDKWAVERACRDFSQLIPAFGGHPRIAVNISAGHLADSDFEGSVLSAVAAHGLGDGGLALEITESVLMQDPVLAGAILRRLRDRGVDSFIDDFGTGYSSLAYLSRLPVTTVKIDRTFIERMPRDSEALAIVASMVDLARTMQMTTIAEGVETVEQAGLLHALGCTAAQGFLWSPAVLPSELIDVVKGLEDGRFDVPPRAATTGLATRDSRQLVNDTHGLHVLLRLHGEGASLFTIVDVLNGSGYQAPHGARWQRETVAQVISHIAYPDLPSSGEPWMPEL